MVEIDATRHLVTASGKPIKLTPKEYKIIKTLAQADGKIVSRAALLKAVWGYSDDQQIDSRTVDQHMARLRGKLRKDGAAISTVTGEGYQAHGVEFISAEKTKARVLGFEAKTGQALIKVLNGGVILKGQTVTLS